MSISASNLFCAIAASARWLIVESPSRSSFLFERGMMPALIDHLARQQNPAVIKSIETVSKISYSGDIGGIMCHIQPEDAESVVVVSLTPVRVRRKLPFAAAVLDYQKHRVKKL